MTFGQYVQVFRQQWWLVLLLTLLSAAGAVTYTHAQVPEYQSTVRLFVSTRGGADISALTAGSSFTQQRVKSYANIITSPIVLDAVISDLHLPYTAAELAAHISATSPLDTVLLDVSVTDTDAQRAAAIANSIAKAFPSLVNRLETPDDATTSPVKVSVTQTATAPTAPTSPRKSLNLALGLLAGLALGVGAAILRDRLNTRVRSVTEVEEIAGAVPLGVVPFDTSARSQPLVIGDQFGGRAEAFRALRTNLHFIDVDAPPRVIVITSPMPDEGKTTSACNIALTLALTGSRVALVEADLRKPRVGRYLGIDSAAGLTTVLSGQHELRDVVAEYGREGLSVLPAGRIPPNPSELLGSRHMVELLVALRNHYDYVVIDAPPLLPVTDAVVLTAASDGALMIVRHGRTKRDQLTRAVQALETVNAKLLGTVINFAPKKARGGYAGYGYGTGYTDKAVTAGTMPVARPVVEWPKTPVAEPRPQNGSGYGDWLEDHRRASARSRRHD